MSKVWFITGSSRGLGRNFVEAALSRGDKVVATARSTESLDDLVAAYGDAALPLDDLRVDGDSAVLHADVPQQLHPAGAGMQLHHHAVIHRAT